MAVVEGRARARVGLLGNPSDLYGGRGLGFAVAELGARVRLEPAASFEPPNELLRAGWKVFAAEARRRGVEASGAFAATITTNVPLRAGLGGSSAILVAALRAWAALHGFALAPSRLAELALSAEVDELGIRAGPLDRLVQAHEGLIEMDFAHPFEEGAVSRLDPALLPPLFLAWNPAPGEDSGDVHAPVFERWRAGEPLVLGLVGDLAALAVVGAEALRAGDQATFRRAVDGNFDLRARLFPIAPRDRQAIELGRRLGAATKFCGSGGSYLVVPDAPERLDRLREDYEEQGFPTLVPSVASPGPEPSRAAQPRSGEGE